MNFSNLNKHTPIQTIYSELYNIAHHILDEKLQYFSQTQYAVDVYKLASSYDIKIYEKYIPAPPDKPAEIFGYLNTYSGKAIYLNTNTGPLTKRYTIVYSLAYYLFQRNNNTDFIHYFINPILPADFKEQFYHIFTSFLIMPPTSVIKLMSQYTLKQADSKITYNSWLNYLGNTLGLSIYHTATSFENVRTLYTFCPKII